MKRAMEATRMYFEDLAATLPKLPWATVDAIAEELFHAYENERTVFLFGNGGSAALASHFACDLGKGTVSPDRERKRLRVMALTDNVPLITAWANDANYEDIFAEQLRNVLQPDDIALAISCSGNSPNVLKALKLARERGAVTIGLGGFDGGAMKSLCDVCVIVPSDNMQHIEDIHLSLAHALFTVVRKRIAEPVRMLAAALR